MTSPTTQGLVDTDKIDELIDLFDGREELSLLFQEFFEDLADRLETIRSGLENGSDEEIDQVAHAIKGSSSNLGALSVQEAAASLEQRARAHDVDGAAQVFQKLEDELARLRSWLSDEHLI